MLGYVREELGCFGAVDDFGDDDKLYVSFTIYLVVWFILEFWRCSLYSTCHSPRCQIESIGDGSGL